MKWMIDRISALVLLAWGARACSVCVDGVAMGVFVLMCELG